MPILLWMEYGKKNYHNSWLMADIGNAAKNWRHSNHCQVKVLTGVLLYSFIPKWFRCPLFFYPLSKRNSFQWSVMKLVTKLEIIHLTVLFTRFTSKVSVCLSRKKGIIPIFFCSSMFMTTALGSQLSWAH